METANRRTTPRILAMVGVGLLALGLVVVGSGYLFVGGLKVPTSMLVEGHATGVQGFPATFHVWAYSTTNRYRLQPRVGATVTLSLMDGAETVSTGEGVLLKEGPTPIALSIPASARAGGHEVHVVLRQDDATLEESSFSFQVLPREKDRTTRDTRTREHEDTTKCSQDGVRLEIFDSGASTVAFLPDTIYARVTDCETWAPLQGRVQLEKQRGDVEGRLPLPVETDRLGLAEIPLHVITDTVWRATVETHEGRSADRSVTLLATPASVRIEPVATHIVGTDPFELDIQTVSTSGAVTVELYVDGARVASRVVPVSTGRSRVTIEHPGGATSSSRLDVVACVAEAGCVEQNDRVSLVWSEHTLEQSAVLARSIEDAGRNGTDGEFLSQVEALEPPPKDEEVALLTKFLGSRLAPEHEDATLLVHSISEAEERLFAAKQEYRSNANIAMAGMAGAGALGATLVVLGLARRRRGFEALLAEGETTEDTSERQRQRRRHRLHTLLMGSLVILAIALFALAMIQALGTAVVDPWGLPRL